MRIIFMGTPQFANPSLQLLIDHGYEIVAVITQPDRPKGRKKTLTPPPVKELALANGLTVLQPERMRSAEAISAITALQPDLIITAAYGQILPKAILELPKLGCINVHGSLLPQYRGGAPIQRSIMNGEAVTGVTIMYMAEGLDTGDMIATVEIAIEDEDTSGSLFDKLSIAGAALLHETLPAIIEGRAAVTIQDEAAATYAPNLSREDERIDWDSSARMIFNQVRGLSPMAGAFTMLEGEIFKIWSCLEVKDVETVREAQQAIEGLDAKPGVIVIADSRGIIVQTGDGFLLLREIQAAGKRVMRAADWVQGARIATGTCFGTGDAI